MRLSAVSPWRHQGDAGCRFADGSGLRRQIDEELKRLGYTCLHRSPDAGNYARSDERLELLYASRPIARRLLVNAAEQRTPLGDLRVVSPEGLIAFKLQALVNNPRRTQDLEDIRSLLRANRNALDMKEVADYFVFSNGSRSSMSSCEKSTDHPIAAEGGLARTIDNQSDEDPYAALDDLMLVVEALCPRWPERESSMKSGAFLL